MRQEQVSIINVEEYLRGELTAEIKHEYVAGQVYAMVGVSRRHNIICGNIYVALRGQLRDRPCGVFSTDVKLRVESADAFYYPDIMVGCDPTDRESYYLERPQVIVEVLSKSTAAVDRREKWYAYQTLASLREYVLVHQETAKVELFLRENDKAAWWQREYETRDLLELPSLGFAMPMPALYENID